MSILLNIDCATNHASVCFSSNEKVIAFKNNDEQKEHASFLHTAIKELADETGISLKELSAIAVTSGPGSYTGLRVGLATAKGICYALNKPLITLNTLEVMAQAAINSIEFQNTGWLLCPMIDARRMEVFTAIYNKNLENILPPCAIEVTSITFITTLEGNSIYFFGSGSEKCMEILKAKNVNFINVQHTVKEVAELAFKAFSANDFANLAYSEPVYLKEFYSTYKA